MLGLRDQEADEDVNVVVTVKLRVRPAEPEALVKTGGERNPKQILSSILEFKCLGPIVEGLKDQGYRVRSMEID